jgi:hypothetical protein
MDRYTCCIFVRIAPDLLMTEQFVGKSVGKNENKTMRPLINIGLQALVRSPVETMYSRRHATD